eukprot:692571-Amphidinium_carterae.1
MHGLIKSTDTLPLYRIPPARPLNVHTKISGSDLDRRKGAGTPGLHKFVFGVSAIADDHRLLRVHLHIMILVCLSAFNTLL